MDIMSTQKDVSRETDAKKEEGAHVTIRKSEVIDILRVLEMLKKKFQPLIQK